MKGKLLVIDGIDGVGKATQAKLLAERLARAGKKVKRIDFPCYYDNHFGALIGECLAGKHGDFLHLDPKIASTLYAADRFESKKDIAKWLAQGYIVIADRYVSSNQIHQGGKIANAKKRKEFVAWLEHMEYDIFGLPRPDLIVYLSLPLRLSLLLLQKSNANTRDPKRRYLRGGKDVVEESRRYLTQSRSNALAIVRRGNRWKEIICNRGAEILPREEIAERVFAEAKKVLT
jgi:dTMP kinase